MKIQLLKTTVKLRIDRRIIVIPREKDNMHNYAQRGIRTWQYEILCEQSQPKQMKIKHFYW